MMKKINTILLLICILLLSVNLFYNFKNKTIIQKIKKDNIVSISDIYQNQDFYKNKQVEIEGYVYGLDIESETKRGNSYLNLRDSTDMKTSKNISIKILSEDIKKSLIDIYNSSHQEWIKVKIYGNTKEIVLPMNGWSGKSLNIEVDKLIIE